ncbi:MAG: hypothetical protein DI613_22030, partial [Kocuria rhizophila]
TFTDKFKDEVNEMIRERINSCVPGQWSSSSRCPDAIGASSVTSVVIKQLPAEFSTRRLTDRTLEGDVVFELTSATGTEEVETTVIVEAEMDDQGMLDVAELETGAESPTDPRTDAQASAVWQGGSAAGRQPLCSLWMLTSPAAACSELCGRWASGLLDT